MRTRAQASLAAVILLLLGLGPWVAAPSTAAPVVQYQFAIRERETVRWRTGGGTEVDGSVQVTPVGGGGAPLTFKLDNQSPGPLGGGVLFTCASTGGTYQVSFAYRNLAGSAPPSQTGVRLMCLAPFNPLELRANGLARRVEFQDNTQVTRAFSVPLEPTFRVRPDNQPRRGGIEVVCESPFEGRIDYVYRYRDLDPPVVTGEMKVLCYQF